MEERKVLCNSCDVYCSVIAEVSDGKVVRIKATDNRPLHANICMKGVHAPEGFAHSSRLLYPLRRTGPRGAANWERISWERALDEIAERLQSIIRGNGPEAFAVSTSPWNIGTDNGMCRRLMNLLGSPNWISGVALCAGNTAAVNRMVYGWFPYPDYNNTRCILLFGHNPKKHSWTPVYNAICRAQQRGAKMIVFDPRRSESAERADLWLPLKIGTDAAMCFGLLNVIIGEELYDRAFVEQWVDGFEAFRRRVLEFPLERVAAITGVEPDLIAEAARLYASHAPGVIPWTPVTDQQRNSTSAIRLQCALRALTGSLDVRGGEVFHGFNPDVVPETDLELHEALSPLQRAKQLGFHSYPVFTYRAGEALADATERVWGRRYANIVSGCYMANPSATFRAMATGIPYPVKAFISAGNNTLLSYANMQLVRDALMNQDLVVVYDQFMTPTAQLADYVLPSDSWLERAALADGFGWTSIYRSSRQAVEPPGECRGAYELWRGLACRLGLGEHFSWTCNEELLDHRLSKAGLSFREFADRHTHLMPKLAFKKYESRGFATPSGKVELYSSILAELGFDPLPYFRSDPASDPAYPLTVFPGVRDDEFFQTGHRHIESLRARKPHPALYVNHATARAAGIDAGDWAIVQTKQGKIEARVEINDTMPDGLVRVPHGWWRPEAPQGGVSLSDAATLADAQLCPDDAEFLDAEQGVPHLKGIPCRIFKKPIARVGA